MEQNIRGGKPPMDRIGIIMNGVTGRMGTNQHLARSIMAIREQGGIALGDGRRVMPEPILVGRSAEKLAALAEQHGGLPWSTDLAPLLADDRYPIYFDAQTTPARYSATRDAIAAGKHVYAEKPSAMTTAEAMELYRLARARGVKHGVVQDKLWLSGLVKLKELIDSGFFGRILSVRGEFGYWVFTGHDQPAQRPSWNYRKEDGGGIISDMLCHWRYILDNLFGNVTAVSCLGATHIPRRVDEQGNEYAATADDAAYATFETEQGIICHINASWCVRVRRDDLVTFQVDGAEGSAVAGLRDCWVQSAEDTPRPVWNPDVPSPVNFWEGWKPYRPDAQYDNAFKVQWELFLRHVLEDAPFRWNLLEGAKGVQLAELGLLSWEQRAWRHVPLLED
jgi:predicted dehydrogenase